MAGSNQVCQGEQPAVLSWWEMGPGLPAESSSLPRFAASPAATASHLGRTAHTHTHTHTTPLTADYYYILLHFWQVKEGEIHHWLFIWAIR